MSTRRIVISVVVALFAIGLFILGWSEPSFGFGGIGIIAFGLLMTFGVLGRIVPVQDQRREGMGLVLVGAAVLAGGLAARWIG
jgi:multisubunit Na+/H+ antiporter MnhB subunit